MLWYRGLLHGEQTLSWTCQPLKQREMRDFMTRAEGAISQLWAHMCLLYISSVALVLRNSWIIWISGYGNKWSGQGCNYPVPVTGSGLPSPAQSHQTATGCWKQLFSLTSELLRKSLSASRFVIHPSWILATPRFWLINRGAKSWVFAVTKDLVGHEKYYRLGG